LIEIEPFDAQTSWTVHDQPGRPCRCRVDHGRNGERPTTRADPTSERHRRDAELARDLLVGHAFTTPLPDVPLGAVTERGGIAASGADALCRCQCLLQRDCGVRSRHVPPSRARRARGREKSRQARRGADEAGLGLTNGAKGSLGEVYALTDGYLPGTRSVAVIGHLDKDGLFVPVKG